ncbi:MAG: hypothetical protein JJE03_07415 [Peptostreptococcaceae bacterium]|nr:hypothetical protein [Peptostreptococcaceae bacterium]
MNEKTNFRGYLSIVASWAIFVITYVKITGMQYHFFTINTVDQDMIFLMLFKWMSALAAAGVVFVLALLIKKVLNKLFKLSIDIALKGFLFTFIITYIGVIAGILFYNQSVL